MKLKIIQLYLFLLGYEEKGLSDSYIENTEIKGNSTINQSQNL